MRPILEDLGILIHLSKYSLNGFIGYLAGTLLGPLVLLNWWIIRKDEELSREVKLVSSASVILILWQGFLGFVTVKMDNLHWSVALHLSSALLFLMSLIWIWLSSLRDKDEVPNWIMFDPILARKWKNRVALLSLGTFIALFIGVFVSTTPGANQGCGVLGFPNSWPLCNSSLIEKVTRLSSTITNHTQIDC